MKLKPLIWLGDTIHQVRAIYVARFSEAVYVLHAFEKKSRKTAKEDLELARNRFRALVRERDQS